LPGRVNRHRILPLQKIEPRRQGFPVHDLQAEDASVFLGRSESALWQNWAYRGWNYELDLAFLERIPKSPNGK
jgi:hypothetical protein